MDGRMCVARSPMYACITHTYAKYIYANLNCEWLSPLGQWVGRCMGGISTNHKSSYRIEISWLVQDLFYFEWFDMTPPIHPPMHTLSISTGIVTNYKSSNRIELSQLGKNLFYFSDLTWSHPSIHPTNHPSTHTLTHRWGSLNRL